MIIIGEPHYDPCTLYLLEVCMDNHLLRFSNSIGRMKPNTIHNKDTECPFCQVDQLTDIYEVMDSTIWLKNKFQTIENTLQTIIIESDDCQADISTYSRNKWRKILKFSIEKWFDLDKTGKYESTVLFKNHGPLSGGSIQHAHMQIIGFKSLDYLQKISEKNFEGLVVQQKEGIKLNLSYKPIMGFTEFNIVLTKHENTDEMADYIQVSVHFILNHFYKGCNSYNLFFYRLDGKIICKITPRFIISPYFVGYLIPQVSSNLKQVKDEMQKLYFH